MCFYGYSILNVFSRDRSLARSIAREFCLICRITDDDDDDDDVESS